MKIGLFTEENVAGKIKFGFASKDYWDNTSYCESKYYY